MRTQVDHTRRIFLNVARRSREQEHRPFIGFVVSGNANVGSLADVYGLEVAAQHRCKSVADYLSASLYGCPLIGDRAALGNIELVVLKKCGRAVEQAGLDFCRRAAGAGAPDRRQQTARESAPSTGRLIARPVSAG